MESLVFACMVSNAGSAHRALALAGSIREFGGSLKHSSIWVLVPATEQTIPVHVWERLHALDVSLLPFDADLEMLKFPFAGKMLAAAHAERQALGKAGLLAWMDSDSLVLNEPGILLLPEGVSLGCRPVDHLLVGPRYDEPLHPFWRLVYEACEASEEDAFPMLTSTDEIKIRPYINAGLLVVRPLRGLLDAWQGSFKRLYRLPEMEDFYRENMLYRIFLHQAALAGTVVATLPAVEILEFPHTVNYPLHMHADMPPEKRAESLEELQTCRYETFFNNPDWQKEISVDEPLRSWLETHMGDWHIE